MFIFDDLQKVDDRGMQELLRQVPADKLLIALKGADETLKAKIFKNMSQRAAEMMKDDLEAKGPVKLSEVEAAQKEILVAARKLADAGTISLGSGRRRRVCLTSRGVRGGRGHCALGPAGGRRAAGAAPWRRRQRHAPRGRRTRRLGAGSRRRARRGRAPRRSRARGAHQRSQRQVRRARGDPRHAREAARSARHRDGAGAHAARAHHRQAPGAARTAHRSRRRSSASSGTPWVCCRWRPAT